MEYLDPTSLQYEEFRNNHRVYVFQFQQDEQEYFDVDYPRILSLMDDGRQDLPAFNLVAHPLFKEPLPGHIDYGAVFEQFFRPVLAMRPLLQAFPLHVDLSTVVIPESSLIEITKAIGESGLSDYQDFILFLICKIQQTYIMDIAFCDEPAEKQRIEKYPKEIKKLESVLDYTDRLFREASTDHPLPELQEISFKFNTESPVKIVDRTLLYNITKAIKEHYSQGNLSDWRKQLQIDQAVWHENQMPNVFRQKICKALHNLLKAMGIFSSEGKETTDKELHAIGQILRFSLLPFRDRNNKLLDYHADWDKIRNQILGPTYRGKTTEIS